MKLLLAEDTSDLNRAITAILQHEHYEVTPVLNGTDALRSILETPYDGIILDIMMPGLSGLEVLSELRAHRITTPVLLLTAKAEVDDRVAGLDAGADDYLTKPFAMKELLARVRSMTRRNTLFADDELHFSNLSLHAESLALAAENTVRLSKKEFELMKILILNAGRPLDADFLLSHVWKSEPEASKDTVWLYVSYLKGKLRAVSAKAEITVKRGDSCTLKEL